MYKMKRENNILRCNIECSICESPFEFIEDKNGEAIVNGINMFRNKDESMNIEFHAKCNVCGYRAKYNGILEL
ncbi:hypothetical protein QTI10_04600 [Clostridium perfringens]|nr:hypothetical protein [Clostridium perfringens]MDM0860815.1 hypothetical protein [Clostridium perfringens]